MSGAASFRERTKAIAYFVGMARFFFNVYNGTESYLDEVGEDLPDRFAAWHEATISAGQSLKDLNGKLLPGIEWRMDVLDESGRTLYTLHVSAKGNP